MRWLFLFALGLATLAALWVTWLNWRGKAEWETCKAELKALQEPLELAALAGKPVPNDQNFAMIPLMVEAADAAQKQRPTTLFSWFRHTSVDGSAWRSSRFVDLASWQTTLRSETNGASADLRALQARPLSRPGEDLLFLLSRNQTEIEQMRKALGLPFADFDYRQAVAYGTLLPKVALMKSFAIVFRTAALSQLQLNQPAAALEDIHDLLRLSDQLKQQPVLITELVRLAILDLALQPIWEGLARHQWNDAQLQQLNRWLQPINCVEDAVRAYRGERALSLTLLNAVPAPQAAPVEVQNAQPPLPRFWPWRYQNQAHIARMFQEMILPVYSPNNRTVDLQKKKAMDQRNEATIKAWAPSKVFARILYPAIADGAYRVASAQASFHLATIAVALERHRLAHGQYPESLEELVPSCLAALPVDPLTAKPPSYQLLPGGRFELVATTESKPEAQPASKRPKETTIRWAYPENGDKSGS